MEKSVAILNTVGRKSIFDRESLSKDLKEVREGATERSERRVLQAKGTAHAKALRQDRAWGVGGTVRRPMMLKQNE